MALAELETATATPPRKDGCGYQRQSRAEAEEEQFHGFGILILFSCLFF